VSLEGDEMNNESRLGITGDSASISFRSVAAGDEAFLLKVYASARAQEMALVPWTDEQKEAFLKMQLAAQLQHYQTYYPEAENLLILLEGAPVGRLYVGRSSEAIRILDIAILPEYRRRGIGTAIIKYLIREAAQVNLPVWIHLEFNNQYFQLFERLGFVNTGGDGMYFKLEWRPGAIPESR